MSRPKALQSWEEIFEARTTHQLERREAQRIEITLRPDFAELFGDEFGSHVLRGSLEQAPFVVARPSGQAEVAELDSLAMIDHQIRGLDVAVNDSSRMQVLESPQSMCERCSERAQVHLPPFESIAEIGLHQFEDQPATVSIDVENRDDVRMLQRREEL